MNVMSAVGLQALALNKLLRPDLSLIRWLGIKPRQLFSPSHLNDDTTRIDVTRVENRASLR